jgi:hypothetical protein
MPQSLNCVTHDRFALNLCKLKRVAFRMPLLRTKMSFVTNDIRYRMFRTRRAKLQDVVTSVILSKMLRQHMLDYQPYATTCIKCSYLAVTKHITMPLFITLYKKQSICHKKRQLGIALLYVHQKKVLCQIISQKKEISF